jgi:hypothetical protein
LETAPQALEARTNYLITSDKVYVKLPDINSYNMIGSTITIYSNYTFFVKKFTGTSYADISITEASPSITTFICLDETGNWYTVTHSASQVTLPE